MFHPLAAVRKPGFWTLEHWSDLLSALGDRILAGLGQAGLIVALFLMARYALFRLVDGVIVPILTREAERRQVGRLERIATLQGLLKSVVSYVLVFIAIVALLQAFGIGVSGILASAGVVGLAVGFGAQRLVRDVISGFFILLEDQYSVGDYVTIGAVSGTVEEIGMRVTKIRDEIGRLYIFSNGDITLVCNYSKGEVLAVVEVSIPAAADLSKATELILAACRPLVGEGKPLLKEPTVEGVVAVDATRSTLRITARTTSERKQEAEMALRAAIARTLRESGIGLV